MTGQVRADFVHLRLHTAYSLLEGAIAVKQVPKLCRKHGMPAAAITDTGNLFGALEFSVAMAEAGIQPIIGSAVALAVENGSGAARNGRPARPARLVLLAQNEAGYRNLIRLSSRSHLASVDGAQVRISDLEDLSDGLIALTGGAEGPVGQLLRAGQRQPAEALALKLATIFPGRLYVELQRHGLPEQAATESAFLDIAYDNDLPIVATNEPYFDDAEMFRAHDALICIAEGSYLVEANRRQLTPEHRFKSGVEMRAAFADLPEAADATIEIARRCAFRPVSRQPILPNFPLEEGLSEAYELRRLAREGLEKRLAQVEPAAPREVYDERLAFELDVIERMNFPGYFLIVSDFIRWAKERGIPVGPGRGSGAGSVAAWALSITDLDPIRLGLLFERFLNPERVSMPDFDVDFCQERRDEVIRYVQQRYGWDRVAQIITFGKLQARAVLRDVGRVLQMPYGQVDRLCKLVPNNPAHPVTLAQAIEMEPRLRQARDDEETIANLLDIGKRLEGLYRHASTHAAGVVIADRTLDELVPLYRDPRSDMPVTQFNMKWVEPAGLVKFDFLGLKTLTVIERARRLLKDAGISIDPAHLPLDDRPTYELLASGETGGVFQLEGGGMRDVLRRLKPDAFGDIIAVVALFRPGPMDNIPKYIACKQGAEEPDYLHPWLEPILKETYGVIIYQEQVMQIAQVLSGYSLGEADLLRRAMGKKIREEMAQQKERFVEGAVAKGVDRSQASGIFELVAKFAEYGFNKSHAAAYALVAYQTAYLKANHPLYFVAASMSLDMGNTDKLALHRQECRRLGLRLDPPDVNRSEAEFVVAGGGIAYALAAIRNIGRHAADKIVSEREQNGRYSDLQDFATRIDPKAVNRRALENLVRAGALDSLEPNRARVLAGLDLLLAHANAATEARHSNQASLFGGAMAGPERLNLPPLADWLPAERLKHEFDAVGFFLSSHPLEDYRTVLQRLRVVTYVELLGRLEAGGVVRAKLAGTVVGRQERRSARGNPYAFVRLTDPSGEYEATVFAEALNACRDLLAVGESLVLTVDAELVDDQPKLRVQSVERLDAVAAQAAAGLKILIGEAASVEPIRACLPRGGRGAVSLFVLADEGRREVEIQLAGGYQVTPQVRSVLRTIPGVLEVQEV